MQHLGIHTEMVHPCLGTEGCQSSSHTASGALLSHSRSCAGQQELSRNGKQSHGPHREASKHIFTWDAEKEASDPPFSPCTSFQRRPPAHLSGQGRVRFSSLPPFPIPFQRPSGLQTCPCITLLTSNCYLVPCTRSQAWVGTKHIALFYCQGSLAGWAGGLGSRMRGAQRG